MERYIHTRHATELLRCRCILLFETFFADFHISPKCRAVERVLLKASNIAKSTVCACVRLHSFETTGCKNMKHGRLNLHSEVSVIRKKKIFNSCLLTEESSFRLKKQQPFL